MWYFLHMTQVFKVQSHPFPNITMSSAQAD